MDTKPVRLEGPLPKICLNKVYDRHNQPLSFYRDVPALLLQLHHSNIQVWAASRTHAPKVARQILNELLLPGSLKEKEGGDKLKARRASSGTISAASLFTDMEIYPGSKMEHFRNIHEKTGIAYEDMLFFDDESRNREVTKLGVTFVLVPNGGTTRTLFETGLEAWRKGLSSRTG
ncbi:hypothetical protein JCM10213v2_002635 [Rhodosporidiobolus nylandii]